MEKKRDTKGDILDAAEMLFAERNYDSVSLRDIMRTADAKLALASYYFENKKDLFEQVIARRADILNERRRRALVQARKGGDLTIESVLIAFMRPYMELCAGSDTGWRSYSRLIANIAQDQQWLYLIARHFNSTAMIFVEALCEIMPRVQRDIIIRSFVFAINVMVAAFSNNQRINSLSDDQQVTDDLEHMFDVMIPFLAGGFRAVR